MVHLGGITKESDKVNMQKKSVIFGLIFQSIILLLSGCWDHTNQQKKKGLVVVNVLDLDLYEDCHIRGSINIPFDQVESHANNIDQDAEIVFYCSDYQCSSSEWAAKTFQKKGFKKVYVYEGGMAEWYQEGLPTEGPHQKAYLHKPAKQVLTNEQAEASLISMKDLAEKMNMKQAAA